MVNCTQPDLVPASCCLLRSGIPKLCFDCMQDPDSLKAQEILPAFHCGVSHFSLTKLASSGDLRKLGRRKPSGGNLDGEAQIDLITHHQRLIRYCQLLGELTQDRMW